MNHYYYYFFYFIVNYNTFQEILIHFFLMETNHPHE